MSTTFNEKLFLFQIFPSRFPLVLKFKVYYNGDYSNYLKVTYFSYQERLRDWPNEVSATGLLEETVLIPIGDKRLEDEKIVFVF